LIYTVLIVYLVLLCLWPADVKRRTKNVLLGVFDQPLYVLVTLGNGSPDECASAAAWRLELKGHWAGRVFRPVIDALFWPLERDHCRLSFESELNRRQLPPEYQTTR
jgi:hypothetical protein